MHLLYSRFFTKAMADCGLVREREPFLRLFNQGQILGADGERMSKSRGNVQDPDELVARYGADTVRLFLMFMGPWDQGGPWSPTGIGGVARFIGRAWTLALDPHGTEPGDPASGSLPAGEDAATAERAIRGAAHRMLARVTADYEAFHFNTMVAQLMELSNLLFRYRGTEVAGGPAWDEAIALLLLMLAPAAPHVTEELWSRRLAARGETWRSIHTERWPEVDAAAAAVETRELPIQVNGKVRDRVEIAVGLSEAEVEALVLARPKVVAALAGNVPDRVIHAGGGRLVNIVVRGLTQTHPDTRPRLRTWRRVAELGPTPTPPARGRRSRAANYACWPPADNPWLAVAPGPTSRATSASRRPNDSRSGLPLAARSALAMSSVVDSSRRMNWVSANSRRGSAASVPKTASTSSLSI